MTSDMLYVYTIYQEGSFSKAAEKLYLTQPALSIAIRKIEDSIGMPLFDRKRKPLQLTDAGEIYIDTIKKVMLLEREQQQKIQDIKNLVTGKMRIGGTHYLNAYILPELFAGYAKLYPGVSLEIYERSAFELSELLERRELDITFSCDPELVELYPHYSLFTDHLLLAVPQSDPINTQYSNVALTAQQIVEGRHLDADCPKAPLEWFAGMDFMLLSKGNNLHDRALQMFDEASVQPNVKLVLNQLVTAFHLAEASMGVTFVSDRIVCAHNNRLLYYPLKSKVAERLFYIILPQNAYVPAAVYKFIEYAQHDKII